MDCRARRSRRGRACSGGTRPDTPHQPWSFLDSFSSFLILSCLIGLIYIMLENHCKTCNSNCDLNNINKSIADIAKNVACMKDRYRDLELKITRFSQEIPKLEGQFELIEAITSAIDKKDAWDPRRCLPLPNVDVFLKTPPCFPGKNGTCENNECPNCLAPSAA